jgi:hypothetical protein
LPLGAGLHKPPGSFGGHQQVASCEASGPPADRHSSQQRTSSSDESPLRRSPPHRRHRSSCASHTASHKPAASAGRRDRARAAHCPMMRRSARLHPNQARRQRREELQDLCPTKLPTHHHLAVCADCVNLKDVLRQIDADGHDIRFMDRLLDVAQRPHHCTATLVHGPSTPSRQRNGFRFNRRQTIPIG